MIIYIAAALIIGFVLGAIEGRASIERAQEIAAAADSEAEALKSATAHAINQLHARVQAGEHEMVAEWANIVHMLRNAL
jgi:hypothetical protein